MPITSPLRNQLTTDMKAAMKGGDKDTLATVRMMLAKLKDADIKAREKGNNDGIDDTAALTVLQGMIKQRRDSIKMYEDNGKPEAAASEQAEITVIEQYLPKQLDGSELDAVIDKALAETGADNPKQMGQVIGWLKQHYAGQLDMGKVSGVVKAKLAAS